MRRQARSLAYSSQRGKRQELAMSPRSIHVLLHVMLLPFLLFGAFVSTARGSRAAPSHVLFHRNVPHNCQREALLLRERHMGLDLSKVSNPGGGGKVTFFLTSLRTALKCCRAARLQSSSRWMRRAKRAPAQQAYSVPAPRLLGGRHHEDFRQTQSA